MVICCNKILPEIINRFILAKNILNSHRRIDFQQKQTSLDILKDYMFSKGITIIEHDDFFFNASSNNEHHIHVFWFKQNDEELVRRKCHASSDITTFHLVPNLTSKLIFKMLKSGFLSAVKTP